MREEKYYGVFDYGDRLTPGVELKIEHTVVEGYDKNTLDLAPIIALGSDDLTTARDQSVEAEKAVFEKIKASVKEWERQAAVTKTYNRALEYLNTPAAEHTSNQWVREKYHDRDTISNKVYQMSVSVWEDTKYDRASGQSVPVAWYVTWDVSTNAPTRGYNVEIAGQSRKRYTDKAAAQKYIEGRKKAFAHLFTEISPPIPAEYARPFIVNGVLLPGYTVQGQEPTLSTVTAAEIIKDILGNDSVTKDEKSSVLEKLASAKTKQTKEPAPLFKKKKEPEI